MSSKPRYVKLDLALSFVFARMAFAGTVSVGLRGADNPLCHHRALSSLRVGLLGEEIPPKHEVAETRFNGERRWEDGIQGDGGQGSSRHRARVASRAFLGGTSRGQKKAFPHLGEVERPVRSPAETGGPFAGRIDTGPVIPEHQ